LVVKTTFLPSGDTDGSPIGSSVNIVPAPNAARPSKRA
jgi:hypothetical protein